MSLTEQQSTDETTPTPAVTRRTGRSLLLLFFGCLLVYHLNGRPHAGVDTIAAPYTAWSLVKHGTLELQHYPHLAPHVGTQIWETPDGKWISSRPIGSALMMVPVIAPFAAFRDKPFRQVNMDHLGKLTSGTCVAGTVVLLFLFLRRLCGDSRTVWTATLLFAFGTCAWSVASQAIWMHGPAMLFLTAALFLLFPAQRELSFSRAIFAGLTLGMAILMRPPTGLFAISTGAVLLLHRRWRASAGLMIGGLVPMLLLVGINLHYFDNLLMGGYQRDNWTMPTPLWLGLSGVLVAPSRGLLVYVPAFLLVPIGLRGLWRGQVNSQTMSWQRWTLVTWLLSALITMVFYAKWWSWYGGWCYGPRLLCETLPILCTFFALAYVSFQSLASRWVAHGLVALSVLVHVVGVFGHGEETDWYVRNERPDHGRWLFSTHDTQIEAYAKHLAESVPKRIGVD